MQVTAASRHGQGCSRLPPGNHRGMDVLVPVLLIAAAVCFGIAAANVAARVNLVALGLLFWVITAITPAIGASA